MPSLNWKGKDELKTSKSANFEKSYPFQFIETFNSPQIGTVQFENVFTKESAKQQVDSINDTKNWKNLLIWGDNKACMLSLLEEFLNQINLIYIDPPFATGGAFKYKIQIGEFNAFKTSKAYSDSWKGGLDSYLNFLYERLCIMKDLLADNGSIYVHLDWHVSHYVKIMLDEIFGVENFRNEIIWVYPAASAQTKRFFMRSFDVILFYTKSNDYIFNDDPSIYMEYSDRVKNALKEDELGTYYYRGGSHNGKKLSQKVYIKENGIFPRDFWSDIPYVRANTLEYQGFSTQKPERLLKRILLASSRENDLIADFFCGAGTTLAVAEKLGRRWIGCDSTKHAIHISRKRILDIFNGNDIISWKKRYERNSQPFLMLNPIQNQIEPEIPPEFMVKELTIDETRDIRDNSRFNVIIHKKKKKIKIELRDYSMPYLNIINDQIKEKITQFSDWIDYWAIDLDYQYNIFNNNWVSYRTSKNRNLILTTNPFLYNELGEFTIAVKVINIFGMVATQLYKLSIN